MLMSKVLFFTAHAMFLSKLLCMFEDVNPHFNKNYLNHLLSLCHGIVLFHAKLKKQIVIFLFNECLPKKISYSLRMGISLSVICSFSHLLKQLFMRGRAKQTKDRNATLANVPALIACSSPLMKRGTKSVKNSSD